MTYIGIDISKNFYVAAALVKGKSRVQKFPNTFGGHERLIKWAENRERKAKSGELVFVMEATSRYHLDCALFLHSRGLRVCVVNPRYVRDFRRAMGYENKTDITDAEVLARFGEVRCPVEWQPPSEEIARLRDLVRRREDLVRMIQQERNRLSVPNLSSHLRESLERVLEFLTGELADVERQIREVVSGDEELSRQVELLESVPGVGFWTAVVVLALVGDIKLFRNKRALVSYFGVNPQNFESGSSVRWSRLSRGGPSEARKYLYLSAMAAVKSGGIFREYKERLVSRGKSAKIALCAVMRKLAGIIYAILHSGRPFSEKIYRQISAQFQISS